MGLGLSLFIMHMIYSLDEVIIMSRILTIETAKRPRAARNSRGPIEPRKVIRPMITITTHRVGQCFGTAATVREDNKVIHTTDTYGLSCETAARSAALDWCRKNGKLPRNPGGLGTRRARPAIKGDRLEKLTTRAVDCEGYTYPSGTELVIISSGQSPDGMQCVAKIDGNQVTFLTGER